MKKILLVLISILFIHNQASAKTPEEVFIEVLNYSKTSSPFSNQINWDDIQIQGLDFIQGKPAHCAAISAIANILVPPLYKLDHHTFVTVDGLDLNDCHIPIVQDESELMIEWNNLDPTIKNPILSYGEHFHGKRIGEYSYIYVPAGFFWDQKDINKRIKEGRKAFKNAQVDTSKGIILDFRNNYGGNNVPMLLSLSALLPNDVLFKFSPEISISLDNTGNRLIKEDNHELIEYGRFDSSTIVNKVSKPTVVLINGFTGSSGAITAFTIKNSMPQSLLIGEESSDTLSVNESNRLPDGNYFNLMILRIYNQDNIMAPLKLEVNEHIEHDYERMFKENDHQIQRAVSILTPTH
jgi:hypothetical protein